MERAGTFDPGCYSWWPPAQNRHALGDECDPVSSAHRLSSKDPGFDASVLSEFRSRLVKGGAESLLFDRLLVLCREQGFLAQHGRQRTDSTHVLGAVRTLTRLACTIETLRAALEALAVAAPDWLRAHADKA